MSTSKMKKILITGRNGLMGSTFQKLSRISSLEFEIIPKTHGELDILDPLKAREVISRIKPQYLINCAGYTNTDKAESQSELARKVNAVGPQILAEICRQTGVKLIHYSTQGVFDGEKNSPYVESDSPCPINVYGRTKWEGEKAIQSILSPDQYLILRISWPYAAQGNNFINTLWERSKTLPEVRVVNDQFGTPNPATLIAWKTLQLLEKATGLLHLSSIGSCSRYELVCFLFEQLRSACRVIPISTSDYPAPSAQRPKNQCIETERRELAHFLQMPSWQEAMRSYLFQLNHLPNLPGIS